MNFSKHKDRSLADVVKVDPGFLQWIIGADFSPETKQIVERALQGEFPKKSGAVAVTKDNLPLTKKSASGFTDKPKLF